MLATFPIGYNIPATDLARARHFYAEKLGLLPTSESEMRIVYSSGGGSFALAQSEEAGKVGYSLMTWYVDDIATEMAELRSKGVVFEEYDWPGLQTTDGVANLDGNLLAWFKDSESNLLALAQLAKAE